MYMIWNFESLLTPEDRKDLKRAFNRLCKQYTEKVERCTKCGTVLHHNGCPKCMVEYLDRQLEDGSSPSLDFGQIKR